MATFGFSTDTDDDGSGMTGTIRSAAWKTAMATSTIDTMLISASSSAVLGASQNNYVIGNVTLHNIQSSGAIDLTGMVPVVANQILILSNIGANTITIKHESASSTAANRFFFKSGADLSLPTNAMYAFVYAAASSRWKRMDGG